MTVSHYFHHGINGLRLLDTAPAEVEVEHIDDLGKEVHDCEDDCGPCGRDGCGHRNCDHADLDGECKNCDCSEWISQGTCGECNGAGEVSIEDIWRGREKDVPCYECGGTGTTRPSWGRR